ncbi:dehydrogenase [Microbacterium sp. YY-01]|uniref:dehydrogenase n=1 Tax=Microbacterium sp. YY-01 TaxID=3421634 RepID=UPI003D17E322
MAAKKNKKKQRQVASGFRSEALAQALEKQDMAAVALALRHGNTVVPLMAAGDRDNPLDAGEVWTYRAPDTGEIALLLFSDAKNKPTNLPPHVGVYPPAWLMGFLREHHEAITTVFIDIAGPHPMQAAPEDLLQALEM